MTDPRRLSALLLPLGAGLFAASTAWVGGQHPGPTDPSSADTAAAVAATGPSDADLTRLRSAVDTQLARVHALEARVGVAVPRSTTSAPKARTSTVQRTTSRPTTTGTSTARATGSGGTRTVTPKPKPKPAPAPKPVTPPKVSTPAPPTHTKTGASGSR
jgi:hypothetical protein